MTRDPEAARAAVERLHVLYAASLPDRLDRLTTALDVARKGDRDALERAWLAAHQLQGSAGSYGYARVSEAIGHVAARVLDDLEKRASLDERGWSFIDGEVTVARKAADERRP